MCVFFCYVNIGICVNISRDVQIYPPRNPQVYRKAVGTREEVWICVISQKEGTSTLLGHSNQVVQCEKKFVIICERAPGLRKT